jgi:hypothetical protein
LHGSSAFTHSFCTSVVHAQVSSGSSTFGEKQD